MQLIDQSFREHYVVLHAMELVRHLALLVLVEIDGVVVVLELFCLFLEARDCAGSINNNQSLHFELFGHTLGLFLLIIQIQLQHQGLREEIEAIEHEELYFPKEIIEKVHVQIIEIAGDVLEALFYKENQISEIEYEFGVALWEIDAALELAEELDLDVVEVVELAQQLLFEGTEGHLEIYLGQGWIDFHFIQKIRKEKRE